MPVAQQPHEWLRERREDRGIRQVDVETRSMEMDPRLKISQSHLSKIEKGHSPLAGLGAEKLNVLRQILGISSEEWVRRTGLNIVVAASPTPDEVRPILDLHRIPVRGLAAAGAAFYSDDNILDYEYVADDEYRVGMLAVQIEGDSMEPTIPDGSRVYVDSRLTDPQDGRMFLVHIHSNGFIVKRAKAVADTWLLLSDNPKYPALTPDEATVVGQVYFVQPRGWRA